MSFKTGSPFPFTGQTPILPSHPFADDVPIETFLVALHVPCQNQLHMGFSFPKPIPACLDSVSIFLPPHPILLLPLVRVLLMVGLSQELLVHPWVPPASLLLK